jgi:hypothetical protein
MLAHNQGRMKARRSIVATPLVSSDLIQSAKTFKKDVKLLLQTPHLTEKDMLLDKYTIKKSMEETGGKHGEVFFVSLKNSGSNQTFAVKRQAIHAPRQLTDRSYRELLIFQHLNQLIEKNKCVNFVELIEWFKATPNIMTPDRNTNFQLMHYVLEYPFPPVLMITTPSLPHSHSSLILIHPTPFTPTPHTIHPPHHSLPTPFTPTPFTPYHPSRSSSTATLASHSHAPRLHHTSTLTALALATRTLYHHHLRSIYGTVDMELDMRMDLI